jgi:zinc transporter 5/7
LHVLADALGSVGVIISSFLVQQLGWLIADPVCSILISLLILLSVYPLIKETVLLLLQRIPSDVALHANHALVEILNLDGVKGYCDPQFWEFVSGNLIGSIHVHIAERVPEQKLLSEISDIIAREVHPSQLTIQLEKDVFLTNLDSAARLKYHYPS